MSEKWKNVCLVAAGLVSLWPSFFGFMTWGFGGAGSLQVILIWIFPLLSFPAYGVHLGLRTLRGSWWRVGVAIYSLLLIGSSSALIYSNLLDCMKGQCTTKNTLVIILGCVLAAPWEQTMLLVIVLLWAAGPAEWVTTKMPVTE